MTASRASSVLKNCPSHAGADDPQEEGDSWSGLTGVPPPSVRFRAENVKIAKRISQGRDRAVCASGLERVPAGLLAIPIPMMPDRCETFDKFDRRKPQ